MMNQILRVSIIRAKCGLSGHILPMQTKMMQRAESPTGVIQHLTCIIVNYSSKEPVLSLFHQVCKTLELFFH